MLRATVLLLLLANGVFLAWTLGGLDRVLGPRPNTEHEPERLLRQVNPEVVKLLPPQAASVALAQAAAVAASAVEAANTFCLETGLLPQAVLSNAERTLREAGIPDSVWAVVGIEQKGNFLIHMGRYADADQFQRKQDELKRMRVDAEILHGAPAELTPGLSLGRFDDRASADAALAKLFQRGVRTAKVVALNPNLAQTRLRVPAADPTLRAKLAGLPFTDKSGDKLAGSIAFGNCAAPVAASAAASATGSLAGSSAGTGGAATGAKPASGVTSTRPASTAAASAPAGARPASAAGASAPRR